MGTFLMLVSHILSTSLIFAFDLDGSASGGPSLSQKVAGYIVMISMSLFVGGFSVSCGYVM